MHQHLFLNKASAGTIMSSMVPDQSFIPM